MFICLASQAIHIQVTNSLDTDSFTQALNRFIAIWEIVRSLNFDNRKILTI